jgi:hypothetical protein
VNIPSGETSSAITRRNERRTTFETVATLVGETRFCPELTRSPAKLNCRSSTKASSTPRSQIESVEALDRDFLAAPVSDAYFVLLALWATFEPSRQKERVPGPEIVMSPHCVAPRKWPRRAGGRHSRA